MRVVFRTESDDEELANHFRRWLFEIIGDGHDHAHWVAQWTLSYLELESSAAGYELISVPVMLFSNRTLSVPFRRMRDGELVTVTVRQEEA